MLSRVFSKPLAQVLRATTRRSSKLPDPYRETYKSYLDPVPVCGFLLVVVPYAWMLYDKVFDTDKDIEPK